MKCLVYVSKDAMSGDGAAVPSCFSEIYRHADKYNRDYGISGVLSYREGYYIQVIEGDDWHVDQLFANIKADSRHELVTMIFERHIDERLYPERGMKLLGSINNDSRFIKLMRSNLAALTDLPAIDSHMLRRFYDYKNIAVGSVATPSASTSKYHNKNLTLIAWPNFVFVEQSALVIELSAQLISGTMSYEQLLRNCDQGSAEQIDASLDVFIKHDILKATDCENAEKVDAKVKPANTFYAKMKRFLNL